MFEPEIGLVQCEIESAFSSFFENLADHRLWSFELGISSDYRFHLSFYSVLSKKTGYEKLKNESPFHNLAKKIKSVHNCL